MAEKSIGILGAGKIGRAIAKRLAQREIHATLANRRGPESLADVVAELGPTIRAGTREEVAAKDIVFVAIDWPHLRGALDGLPDFGGRILVDANNSVAAPPNQAADTGGRLSSEVVARLVPSARVVKAFNHLLADTLAAGPAHAGGRRVLFYSGDDATAKAEIAALIARLGFAGIDLGSLAVGARLAQFPGGPLPGLDLVQLSPT